MEDVLHLQDLNVEVVGDGTSYVVLAHGFGTDQSAWEDVLPYLTHDYKVVLFDLACSCPDYFDISRYSTLDGYVDDLLEVLDSLNITACSYVGHSSSALIGLLAAIRRPSLFSKLILIGATPKLLNDEEYNGGFEIEQIEMVFRWLEANYAAWHIGYPYRYPRIGPNTPRIVAEFIRTFFTMRADMCLIVCRTMFNWDFRGVLGLVTSRCFILQTSRDIFVPRAALSYMSANIGGRTDVIRLNTVGHVPHISAPHLTALAIRRALRTP